MKRLKDFVERKFRYDVDIALFCVLYAGMFIYIWNFNNYIS